MQYFQQLLNNVEQLMTKTMLITWRIVKFCKYHHTETYFYTKL